MTATMTLDALLAPMPPARSFAAFHAPPPRPRRAPRRPPPPMPAPMPLDALLAPMPPARFFAEFHDRQPLHLRGAAGKLAPALSWRGTNRLIDPTHPRPPHALH